jgi:hypothetical protein
MATALLAFSSNTTLSNGVTSREEMGTLGGDLYARQVGGVMAIHKIYRPAIKLRAHAEIQRTLDLGDVVEGRYLRPGRYRLHLRYDERIEAEANLRVTFVPERDFPRVIEMFEKGVPGTGVRTRAADMLHNLTWNLGADRIELNPSHDDTPQKMKAQADQIRLWWSRNKGDLRLEHGFLMRRGAQKK